jgi:WD40 repeat protein
MNAKVDIMSFNKEKLNLINDDFNKLGMSLQLKQFLKIMLHHSDIKDDAQKIDYVEALIDAFEQIDVNGDESLEWDEFSNFIVERGIARQKKNYIDVIRNYHLSSVTKDKNKHDAEINKLFFIPALKHLLVLENGSKKLKVYNFLNAQLLHSFDAHSGSVIAAEYLQNQNLVVTSGADNCLMFWNPAKNYQLVNKIPTREIQFTVKWVNSMKVLVTGGFDSVLNCYRHLEFEDNGKLKNSVDLYSMKRLHNEMITDILIIEQNNLIVACDLDGVITLWYLSDFENKYKLTGHLKGILSLACIESKNLLLSCGYEHEVFIWDLVVGKKISTLQGHSQSLIGVKVFPGTFQIITGDVSGIFKVWDYRNMTLVQTFSIPSGVHKRANSFCVSNFSKKRIMVAADKVYFFDYEESQEGNLADSKPCIAVIYNEVFTTFVTAHLNCIKIWDAQTGSLKQVFRDVTDSEISFVSFDKRKRKLFIGDVEGKLSLINILNGVTMKFFTKHKDYISSMAYYDYGKKFISASWDGFIKIHDDNSPDEKGLQLFELVHSVPNHVNSCNSIDFSDKLEVLASGYDNGNVTMINMKSLSSEGTLSDHKKVVVVKFLNNHPALVICDTAGLIHFWSLIPTKPKKITKDFVEENKSINENNRKEFFPVKCLVFEESTGVILTGDETGYIKAWDIRKYIEYLQFMSPPNVVLYSEVESNSLNTSNNLVSNILKSKSSNLNFENSNSNSHSNTSHNLPYITSTTPTSITLDKLLKYRDSLDIKSKLIKEWKAHKNGVTSMTSFNDPVFYITAGLDFKVYIWNDNFEKIGSLTTIRDPEWSLKINVEAEMERRRLQAIEFYGELKAISYESLFEGETKLHALDNDDDY